MNDENTLFLPDIVGKGYKQFWEFKGRYRVVKGSRGSKKSKTTALYYIVNLLKYPGSNLLVIRKTFRSLKDSCFTELKWAINRLGVSKYFKFSQSPLQIEYALTGQKIYFRGLDDPLKVTSITVDCGVLCWLWIEEAYEITSEANFDTLNESIRGQVPDGLFKQVTLTFNPWNERHWIKKRFYDQQSDDILAITTTYLCNEYLDEADLKVFHDMKIKNPRRYQVAGLGNWGIVDGLVYEHFEELPFNVDEIRRLPKIISAFGLDFGFTNDPSALFCGLIDTDNKNIYVFDEIYEKGLTNPMLFEKIQQKGYAKEIIKADSAEPKSIAELRNLGMYRIRKSKKGPDSIMHGIDTIKNYKIIVHPSCVNFLTEISNYCWQKNTEGLLINKPFDDCNHLMDAMRYAMEGATQNIFSFE